MQALARGVWNDALSNAPWTGPPDEHFIDSCADNEP